MRFASSSPFVSLAALLISSASLHQVQAAIYDPPPHFPVLPVLPPGLVPGSQRGALAPVQPGEHEFTLRHIFHHGTHKYPELHRRLDVPKDASVRIKDDDGSSFEPIPALRAKSNSVQIQRLADRGRERIDALLDAGRDRGSPLALDATEWSVDELSGPNMTDKETVVTFARIAANAYVMHHEDPEWEPIKGGFNYTEDFGWENDGLRGHIFADTENKTVIIGLKGTSPAVWDGTDTTSNDKINDNLFFSCCCGQGGQFFWKQVCDCRTAEYRCNSTCVIEALRNKNRYYYAAREIYLNVTEIYPNSAIWLSGHSLGGATSALVALTYGIPTMTFEAPGDAMAASRLGLPTPPGYNYGFHQQRDMTGIYQIGHTADPIFMGVCNTAGSACTIGGYAMQSRCHTGQVCEYDTVGDFGWRVGIGNHRVKVMLKSVIEKYPEVPKCEAMKNCTDCFNWEYFKSHSSSASSKSSHTSTTASRRRTSTCKTPGWFGCLDESTSTSTTTTTTTKSKDTTTTTETTTTTCETPGWFGGCNDKTTSIDTRSATTLPRPTSALPTQTSEIPTQTQTSSPSIPISTSLVSSSSSTTCISRGWFGCKDLTSTSQESSVTSSPAEPPSRSATATLPSGDPEPSSSCAARDWWGRCKEWTTTSAEGEMNFEL